MAEVTQELLDAHWAAFIAAAVYLKVHDDTMNATTRLSGEVDSFREQSDALCQAAAELFSDAEFARLVEAIARYAAFCRADTCGHSDAFSLPWYKSMSLCATTKAYGGFDIVEDPDLSGHYRITS